MKKLPSIRWASPPDYQPQRLARWLRAWNIEKRLIAGDTASQTQPPNDVPARSQASTEVQQRIAPFDSTSPVPGEVRLLGSQLLPGCSRPVYVAVLADWEEGLQLVAPYSRFGEPATTGELLTARQASALSVLCLWNTHSVPVELLAQSWVVDRLSPEELADAWLVFQHVATGKVLSLPLSKRIGPPVIREDDPRVQYQAQELELLAPLRDEAVRWLARSDKSPSAKLVRAGTVRRPTQGRSSSTRSTKPRTSGRPLGTARGSGHIVVLPGLFERLAEAEIALAAAAEKPAQRIWRYRTSAPVAQVRLTLEGDGQTVSLWVLDLQGEPSDVLEGSKVLTAQGEPIGQVARSQCLLLSARIATGLQLCTKDGKIVPLRPVTRGS